MTLPEVRRLLLALADDPARQRQRWAWSHFRRRHQAVAKQYHSVRRPHPHLMTADPPVQTLAAALPELTDGHWGQIVSLLPAESAIGRPRHDHRCILNGILWVIRSGAGWNQCPETFGPGGTVQRSYRRWRENGAWTAVLTVLLQSETP